VFSLDESQQILNETEGAYPTAEGSAQKNGYQKKRG